MNILKNIGDGILKSLSPFKQQSEGVFECLKEVKCDESDQDLKWDDLKRELAIEKERRDERLIELLKQIEENTRG